MRASYRQAAHCLLAALALATGATAVAQDDRWFRVELLVFARGPAGSAAMPGPMAERWAPTPALAYPGEARFLVNPEQVAANAALYRAHSAVDEFGRQVLTLLPPPGEQDEHNARDGDGQQDGPGGQVSELAPGAAPEPSPEDLEEIIAGAGQLTPVQVTEEPPPRPTPFLVLPPEQMEFVEQAARMQRGGSNTLLFHASWLQPVAAAAAALPIILDRSGDTLPWPQLQGSIKLYLARYLHLETNLWLNTAGDYLPGTWRMPAPPLGPASLIIEELPLPPGEDPVESAVPGEGPMELYRPGEDPVALVLAGEKPLQPESAGGDPLAPLPSADVPAQALPEQAQPTPVVPDPGPPYPYRHAVLLAEKRRMRSNEIHYLDHPLFGLVIRLLPLSEEELLELALAEIRGDDPQAL